ncbi:glycosyltransferase family 2 protein [Cyanobium sp. ATX 6F1]|uniref:glycosyltransferase family 2 protein n=2 Tax=unclassified Cyanobium TaxID=2627006 RepID=UPI0020CEAF94|nr:glycosyltransferase family 2 protein [Cyanobium sp. ATX 6F1]
MLLSVAYRSQAALEALAADLAHQSLPPALWLVVDNAPESAPLQADELQVGDVFRLDVLRAKEGEGFGAGCNRGFDHLAKLGWRGWVWLLNPDTALPRGDELATLASALATLPAQAVAGTAVREANGALEPSGGWMDPGLDFRRRKLTESSLIEALASGGSARYLSVDWLSGCSLALRPQAHTPPARFDPAFPLYYEDMDLCLRLAGQGAPVLWLPDPAVIHQRGEGSHTPSERRLRLSTVSYLRFLRRHRPRWVLGLRLARLWLKALLRLPLQPRQSAAVFAATAEALTTPKERP